MKKFRTKCIWKISKASAFEKFQKQVRLENSKCIIIGKNSNHWTFKKFYSSLFGKLPETQTVRPKQPLQWQANYYLSYITRNKKYHRKKYKKIRNNPTLADEGLEIRETRIRDVQVEGLDKRSAKIKISHCFDHVINSKENLVISSNIVAFLQNLNFNRK